MQTQTKAAQLGQSLDRLEILIRECQELLARTPQPRMLGHDDAFSELLHLLGEGTAEWERDSGASGA